MKTVYRDPSGLLFDGRALPGLVKANMISSNYDVDDDRFHGRWLTVTTAGVWQRWRNSSQGSRQHHKASHRTVGFGLRRPYSQWPTILVLNNCSSISFHVNKRGIGIEWACYEIRWSENRGTFELKGRCCGPTHLLVRYLDLNAYLSLAMEKGGTVCWQWVSWSAEMGREEVPSPTIDDAL